MSDETYETFMQRCDVFLPHADCVLISIVYKLAKFSHRHDVRRDERDASGEPIRYFEHLRRVALILMDVGIVDRTTLLVSQLVRFGDWKVLAVKIADRIDNLRSLGNSSAEFRRKQCNETAVMYLPLTDLAIQRAPDEYKENVRELAVLLNVTLHDAQGMK